MPNGIRCPNPRCQHRFTAEAIKRSPALTCPACGMTFRFRPAAPGQPESLPPPALVVSPAKHYRRHRRRSFFKGLLIFLVLSGLAGGVLYHYRDELANAFDRRAEPEEKAAQVQANFSFRPAQGWRADDDLRHRLRANLAVSHKKPRGHFALFYRDYKDRSPGDGEMLDFVLTRLRAFFPQVEYDDPFTGKTNGRTGELSAEPAVAFTFSAADVESVPMRGQCLMLTRRGYAYWLVFWCPEDYHEELADGREELRQGFQLHDERDGWKPAPRPTEVFAGTKVAYQLDFATGLWNKIDNPKEADAAAELLLRGFEPSLDDAKGKRRVLEHAGKAAEVRVLVLPKAADLAGAVAAVQEHLREKLAVTNPTLKIELVTDRKTGKSLSTTTVGRYQGQMDRLRLALSPDNERYARVAVVHRPGAVLAVVCECRFDRRDFWDQEFKALMESLRPAKGPATP